MTSPVTLSPAKATPRPRRCQQGGQRRSAIHEMLERIISPFDCGRAGVLDRASSAGLTGHRRAVNVVGRHAVGCIERRCKDDQGHGRRRARPDKKMRSATGNHRDVAGRHRPAHAIERQHAFAAQDRDRQIVVDVAMRCLSAAHLHQMNARGRGPIRRSTRMFVVGVDRVAAQKLVDGAGAGSYEHFTGRGCAHPSATSSAKTMRERMRAPFESHFSLDGERCRLRQGATTLEGLTRCSWTR